MTTLNEMYTGMNSRARLQPQLEESALFDNFPTGLIFAIPDGGYERVPSDGAASRRPTVSCTGCGASDFKRGQCTYCGRHA